MRGMKWILGLGCVGSMLFSSLTAHGEDVVDRFQRHVQQLEGVSDDARSEALQVVDGLAADPYSRDLAIGDGLLMLYPEFAGVMEALGEERIDDAVSQLSALGEHSDPYLAAASMFLQARAEIMRERYAVAIPLLEKFTAEKADYSSQIGDALYFLGMCQSAMLENDKAITSLVNFLEQYPNAPERMRVGAWRRLQELRSIEEGSMTDVLQRMEFSRRQLQGRNTGDRTQEEQDRIVSMLTKLIEEAEQSECQGGACNKPGESESEAQSQAQSQGQGGQQSGNGSRNPNGVASRSFEDGPASEWSRLRDRSRDPAFNAIKDRYPPRYQALLDQYYRNFQQGEEPGTEEGTTEQPGTAGSPE
ncbi:MAG: hypothetical protein KDA83_10240 [Planctomycetales bacterium]|nr:hypothetical protein [Planctomycetales bacterium]